MYVLTDLRDNKLDPRAVRTSRKQPQSSISTFVNRFELRVISALVLICSIGTELKADEQKYLAGIGFTSNLVSNGISYSDGNPAIHAYAEIRKSGFYTGLYMSKVDYLDEDDIGLDLYLGYRANIEDKILVDASYAHYFYDETGECCGQVKVAVLYRLIDDFGLNGFVAYNFGTKNFNQRVGLAYKANDQLNLTASYGKTDLDDNEYWNVGASYAFTRYMSVKIEYHGAQSGDEGLVIGLAVATDQSSVARLLAGQFGR